MHPGGLDTHRANVRPTNSFDIDLPWRLNDRVSLRPEPFGALAYDFSTRRLSFLKSRKLVALVESLEDHPSARAACDAAGLEESELAGYERALATLASSGIITEATAG